jgi:glycosyltransferase involved in cell wall biosynthesis
MTSGGRRSTIVMAHDYPPLTGGGLALDVRELAELVASDHDVVVLSSRLRDHFADDRHQVPARLGGVRYDRVRAARLLGTIRRADLVVTNWTFSCRWLSTVATLLAPLVGKKTICIVFTAPEHLRYNRLRHLPGLAHRGLVAILARAMRRCAAVVALGPSHRSALEAAGMTVTHVLPMMVSPPPAAPGSPWERRPTSTPRTIGVAGELSALKGSERLSALFDALTPEFAFRVAGTGPLAASLWRHRDGLPSEQRDQVALLGWVPPERMASFYRSVDFLLLLSRTEAQPRVVLEAMQAGVLVAAAPVTGAIDALVDGVTGLLVDVGEPKACRRRLAALAADTAAMEEMRRRAAEYARGHLAECRERWRGMLADALDEEPRPVTSVG